MATVTPGKQFAVGEKVTRDKLNQLGQPTVVLDTGEVGLDALDPSAVRQLVPSVNRNVLINGGFNVWQRGGFTGADFFGLPTGLGTGATSAFGPDRWYLGTPPGANYRRITQFVFTPGQSDVPGEPIYGCRWEQLQVQSPTIPCLSQRIENVRSLAGKTVTVSGYVKADKSITLTIRFNQAFNPSAPDISVLSGQSIAVVGSAPWVRFEKTFTLPTLVGHAVSSNNYLECRLEMPVADTYIVDFANIQVEQSASATDFEYITPADEIARCQRYYELLSCVLASSVATNKPSHHFNTRKRVVTIPTILGTPSGTGGTFLGFVNGDGFYQDTAHSAIELVAVQANAEL